MPRTAARHATAGREAPSAAEIKALFEAGSYQEVPLDGMRRTIAARLTQAAQTIPHFYLTADVDIGRLIALREEANNAAPKDHDGNPAFKLSVNDFIIRALALALQACRPPTRSGPAIASCAFRIPISAWRLRSRVG